MESPDALEVTDDPMLVAFKKGQCVDLGQRAICLAGRQR